MSDLSIDEILALELELERRLLAFIRDNAANLSTENYNQLMTQHDNEQIAKAQAKYEYTKKYIADRAERLNRI